MEKRRDLTAGPLLGVIRVEGRTVVMAMMESLYLPLPFPLMPPKIGQGKRLLSAEVPLTITSSLTKSSTDGREPLKLPCAIDKLPCMVGGYYANLRRQ